MELPTPPGDRDRAPPAGEGQPSEVTAYAWAAQCRLCTRFRQLAARRDHNVAVVAVARELAGFVWGMMTDRLAVS